MKAFKELLTKILRDIFAREQHLTPESLAELLFEELTDHYTILRAVVRSIEAADE